MEDVKSNHFYNRYDNQAAAKKKGLVPRFSLTFSFFRASEYMEEVVSDSPCEAQSAARPGKQILGEMLESGPSHVELGQSRTGI